MSDQRAWRPILYICPRTGRTVQGLLAEEAYNSVEPNKDRYEPVSCVACAETHLVNPVTGIVRGVGPRSDDRTPVPHADES